MDNVTFDLDTLAFAAKEAMEALDRLSERKASLPEEVYLARTNLTILAESLAAMEKSFYLTSKLS